MESARGNAADVPGTLVPWLPFTASTSPGAQSIHGQNRLGGSAEARGRASGSSWSATLDCSWGSSSSARCSRRFDGTTRYLLDGLSVVAQYTPSGERQAFYVQSLARIDEVLSVVNSVGKFWYQADALGSVYTLTTAAGDVRARGGYDVFGEPVAEYGQQVGQPFGFTGREHELDSGLVYARARYLQPGVGRWASRDPLAFSYGRSGGPSAEPQIARLAAGEAVEDAVGGAYGYVRGMPTMAVDPSGAVLIYTGLTGKAVGPLNGKTGVTLSVGGIFAFGAAFNSAIALTAGYLVQPWSVAKSPSYRGIPFNLSVAGELGIYPGALPDQPYNSVCDYVGPFGSLAADIGNLGFSVVWAVNKQLLDALAAGNLGDLAASLGRPVGLTFSAGWNLIPGYGASIVVTESVVFNTYAVCCK